MKKTRIRSICDLFIGILCVSAVITGYYKDVSHMGEYCFISGLLVGSFFLFSFGYRLKGKKETPAWLYFDCMLTLLVILIATITIGLNLEGAFWFIHIINPIIIFLYWCIFCDHQKVATASVTTVLVFPSFYLLLAFVLRETIGISPFPASMIFNMSNAWARIAAIVVLEAVFLVLGFILHFSNRFFNRRKRSALTEG